MLVGILMLNAKSIGQTFPGVTAEAFPANPQSGPHNYFGVRVTLAETCSHSVTVSGYIYDLGNGPNTDHPFTITVPVGELTAETPVTFYETDPTATATVDISTVSPWPGYPLLNLTSGFLNYITQMETALYNIRSVICTQVDALTSDVTVSSGILILPNWIRFLEVGDAMDSLNGVWDIEYANKMNAIIDYAYTNGLVNGPDNAAYREDIWDMIEETLFIVPENQATSCLENKFGFSSLETTILNNENNWLDAGGDDMSQNPALNEDVPEEFWGLLTPYRQFSLNDNSVLNLLQDTGGDTTRFRRILSRIKEIAEILGLIINGIEQVANLMEDCDGSTEAKVRRIRNGFEIENGKRKIGYEMEQRSITFDFNSTDTKIKGKAKLFKQRKRNPEKYKKDRKNEVGIAFCAKEWNNCDSTEWPSDPGVYQHPVVTEIKKVKTWLREPKALAIEKSWHFLRFQYYGLGIYQKGINLLGVNTCE